MSKQWGHGHQAGQPSRACGDPRNHLHARQSARRGCGGQGLARTSRMGQRPDGPKLILGLRDVQFKITGSESFVAQGLGAIAQINAPKPE